MALVTREQSVPTRDEFHRAIGRGADAWYGACLRITGNEALAQDAVQDALLKAWTKRDQFGGNARLETWIHRIAINSALALLRRKRPEADAEPDELPAAAPTPLQEAAAVQTGTEVANALERLSEMERICFELKHVEQWRLKEIAERLDTGVGQVKQALFRALGKLRADLAQQRRQA